MYNIYIVKVSSVKNTTFYKESSITNSIPTEERIIGNVLKMKNDTQIK
jgi:hypothetical protein